MRSRRILRWPRSLKLTLLLLMAPSVCLAKGSVATFIITPPDKQNAQKTGSLLNWMTSELIAQEVTKAGLNNLDRGLFFSRSNALSARRWNKRGLRVASEGYQSYKSEPDEAAGTLLRASRFLEFAYGYYLDRDNFQKTLFLAGILQFKKGSKGLGIRFLQRGLLVSPAGSFPSEFGPIATRLTKAVQCKLSQAKPATLNIKMANGGGRVFLNDFLVGVGSLQLKLPPGEYLLTIRKDGFRNWGRKVRLNPGQTRTVRVNNRRSPRASFYRGLCAELATKQEGEPLTDQLTSIARVMRRQFVERLLIGCFAPGASGTSGLLTWYAYDTRKKKGSKGKVRVPSDLDGQKKAIQKAVSSIGFAGKGTLPSLSQYSFPSNSGTCEDPTTIVFKKPVVSVVPRVKPPTVLKWNVAAGDWIVVYTHFGFRLQGKVMSVNNPYIVLRVASGRRAPDELKNLKLHRKMAKGSWILGPKQEGGFRLGERLIVQTVFGINVHGTLKSDDGDRIKLKTVHGTESIPWSTIRRLLRRDQ